MQLLLYSVNTYYSSMQLIYCIQNNAVLAIVVRWWADLESVVPAAAGRSCFDERTEHGQKHVVQSICPDPDPCVLSSSFLSPLYAGQDPAEGRKCINCRRMRI